MCDNWVEISSALALGITTALIRIINKRKNNDKEVDN
jgi:hypothetical protein